MFVFDVNEVIGYNEYIEFISLVKANFDSEKRNLFNLYNITDNAKLDNAESYIEFRNKYRNLRQKVISVVLSKFRGFLPRHCLIYEFGSLTKFTDRIESDIDLTICYDDKKKNIYECVEELINYSIVYIFENSIDHIHGKFQHYPIMHDFDDLTENDNLYVLKFDKGTIEYKCGPETLAENLMNIKNVRDYSSLIDGYREKYTFKCNIDCLYSIQIIENTTSHDFIGDLVDLENQNNICSDYHFNFKEYTFENEIEISYIKKAFKNTIVSMYIMISFLRKKVNWLKQYSMTMADVFNSEELMALFGVKYMKTLKESFIRMIFYWDRIELFLKKNGILLSTRCHKVFFKQDLDDMLFAEYKEIDLMDKILCSINDMNTTIFNGWRLINEKIK